jgi:hypothetical protein
VSSTARRDARHAQHMHVAVADLKHEQHIEPPQRERAVDVEEVDREHAGGLGAQELPPAGVGVPQRSRRDPVALEDPPDRRGVDAVAECEQLALQPDVSPARVLPRHSHHQGDQDVVDRRTSRMARVGPSSADKAAMPAQDRVRSDHVAAPQRAGQPPHERGQYGPVRPVQSRLWVGAAQDGDLVTQHEKLDVLGGGGASEQ